MIAWPDSLVDELSEQPETGMGYWIVTVRLTDGREFDRVVVNGGFITQIFGMETIPFDSQDIAEFSVTHDKWRFS